MDKNIELANLIFPNITKTVEDYEKMYPERNLPEGAKVTRYAPSPTGFIHIGALLSSFTGDMIARQSNGVFYLRIEDTDTERTIENGINVIIEGLKEFGVDFDEGPLSDGTFKGNYGPYVQSQRKEIYHAFIKHLIIEGKAYPCFCTKEENDAIREHQTAGKKRIGYYGKYAKCRNIPTSEAIERIKNGDKYIIRLKSPGCFDRRIVIDDLIKGRIEMPENDIDIPIMKGDGLPTYHFAHLVDDHLMKTTVVIRGDEWLSSVPLHLQLFQAAGFKAPRYAHIAPLMKMDEGGKRKISKRKDPEAAVSYYHEQGIPPEAVCEYLLNIANSNFEGWRKANPQADLKEFELQFNKMGVSGALFDMVKLLDIAKTIISKFNAEKVYNETLNWAKVYDEELLKLLENKEYALKIIGIERGNAKPRKDISKWSDVKNSIIYMYDEKFFENEGKYEFGKINDKEEINKILKLYLEKYFNIEDDKQTWFDKMKDLAEEMGYAKEVKEYKQNPENWKGHVGDISTVLRVTLTKRQQTPDLYEIMQVLGKENIEKRINILVK